MHILSYNILCKLDLDVKYIGKQLGYTAVAYSAYVSVYIGVHIGGRRPMHSSKSNLRRTFSNCIIWHGEIHAEQDRRSKLYGAVHHKSCPHNTNACIACMQGAYLMCIPQKPLGLIGQHFQKSKSILCFMLEACLSVPLNASIMPISLEI